MKKSLPHLSATALGRPSTEEEFGGEERNSPKHSLDPQDPSHFVFEIHSLRSKLEAVEKEYRSFAAQSLGEWRRLVLRNVELAKDSGRYRIWRILASLLRPFGKTFPKAKLSIQSAEENAAAILVESSGLFDVQFYSNQFQAPDRFTARKPKKAIRHYLRFGIVRDRKPSSIFDGRFYLNANADVAASGMNPLLHFILHGVKEGRLPDRVFDQTSKSIGERGSSYIPVLGAPSQVSTAITSGPADALEQLLPGISAAVAIPRAKQLEEKLAGFEISVDPDLARRVNVFVPHLHPSIIFGGYSALFEFLRHLRREGSRLRIIVTEPTNGIGADLALSEMKRSRPDLSDILDSAEVCFVGNGSPSTIGPDDVCVAYSAWTAHQASRVSSAINRRHFIFFIQEYEPVFYPNNSLKVLVENAYELPHIAVFNTKTLENYFRLNYLGVFDGRNDEFAVRNSGSFPHVPTAVEKPVAEELEQRTTRRLVFYARPERHAERNLFEIGLMALKEAVRRQAFSGSWEFFGIGSLRTSTEINLGDGNTLHLAPRLEGGAYGRVLKSFDVGLSLIYAPHPGVVHFEMAAAGLCVVTNTYANRSAADLTAISGNIIAVPPSVQGIADGLIEAVNRCTDVSARLSGATALRSDDWSSAFAKYLIPVTEAMRSGDWPTIR